MVGILREMGVRIELDNIWCAEGARRREDRARWGASRAQPLVPLLAAAGPWSGLYHLHSWDTMTDCARRGVEIVIDGTEIEAHKLPTGREKERE
jgi:hypothetical protein